MSRLHDLRRFSSFSTVCQSTDFSATGKWTADFDFWGQQRTRSHDACGFSSFAEAEELQAQTIDHEDGCGACSPPLWTSTTPLLPGDHCYSYPSPRSRLQAIMDGRKEIMEMIKDLPESSYELSLKDIVDEQTSLEQQKLEAGHKDGVMACRSLNSDKRKEQRRKKCTNRQISRSQSMDTGVFLLKTFVPVSWGLKRRSTTSNRSKVSPRPLMEAPEKAVDHKGWWKSLSMGDGKNSRSSSSNSSSSTGSTTSIRNRHEDMSFTPSCWSFFKKNRFRRQ